MLRTHLRESYLHTGWLRTQWDGQDRGLHWASVLLELFKGSQLLSTQRDREGGAEVLKVHHWWYIVGVELSKTFALCKMFLGGDGQCCVPTCESHTCTQDGFVPNEAAKTEVCTGQACSLNCLRGRGCCQPQRDREGGAEVLKVHHWWYIVGVELSKTFALCKMFLGGDGQCCEPTCESHTCTQMASYPMRRPRPRFALGKRAPWTV